jgi:hypothetical protein
VQEVNRTTYCFSKNVGSGCRLLKNCGKEQKPSEKTGGLFPTRVEGRKEIKFVRIKGADVKLRKILRMNKNFVITLICVLLLFSCKKEDSTIVSGNELSLSDDGYLKFNSQLEGQWRGVRLYK